MKKISILLMILTLFPIAVFAGERSNFVIGVAPHSSPRIILQMYAPLQQYMEKVLGMSVEIVTAPNFDIFANCALAKEYDIAVTTGHQARLLQIDAHYSPLLTYKADFKSVVLVLRGGAIHTPQDLHHKDVLGLSPTSLVTLWGQQWLKKNNVRANPTKYVSASDSLAQLLIAGEAAAAFTSLANYQNLDATVRPQLQILEESGPMVGRVYMLQDRWAGEQKKIKAALWAFADTREAQEYFAANKLEGYRALRPGELEELDVYAEETRNLLKNVR